MGTLKYWVWLSSLKGVGAVAAGSLLRRFASPELVYFAREADLRDVPDVGKQEINALANKDLTRVDKILSDCEAARCRVMTIQDAEYPERLRNIYDPPIVLYIRGRLPVIDEEPVFAIVGTRKCSLYGLKNAEQLGYGLARHGFVVVTGLARGVDTAAAKGALRGGGRVVGLLGGGVDVIYPPENQWLYEDVSNSGALVSEYPPGSETIGAHFPVRNRLISGLSLGIGIIEAPLRSGALITASRALEQGRDVFAMPGNVDSVNSAGTNRLLHEGAIPLLSAEDVAKEYEDLFTSKIVWNKSKIPLDPKAERRLLDENAEARKNKKNTVEKDKEKAVVVDKSNANVYIDRETFTAETAGKLNDGEKTVYTVIAEFAKDTGTHIDDIIQRSGLSASEVLGFITMLEIDGHIRNIGSGFYNIAFE